MNDIKDFEIENGVLEKYTGDGGKVIIPEGVTSINVYAFDRCDSLTLTVGKGSYAEKYAKENKIPFVAE